MNGQLNVNAFFALAGQSGQEVVDVMGVWGMPIHILS